MGNIDLFEMFVGGFAFGTINSILAFALFFDLWDKINILIAFLILILVGLGLYMTVPHIRSVPTTNKEDDLE